MAEYDDFEDRWYGEGAPSDRVWQQHKRQILDAIDDSENLWTDTPRDREVHGTTRRHAEHTPDDNIELLTPYIRLVEAGETPQIARNVLLSQYRSFGDFINMDSSRGHAHQRKYHRIILDYSDELWDYGWYHFGF